MSKSFLSDALEPLARPLVEEHINSDRIDGRVIMTAAEFSGAVSLKRIADSLEKITNQLDGSAKGMNLYDFASGIYSALYQRG